MRVEFVAAPAARTRIAQEFGAVAEPREMEWRISPGARRRVALLASSEDHCLLDLLWRQRRGELDMSVDCVLSNHETLREEVERLGVEYVHIPVAPGAKPQAEQAALARLAGRVELVVLARYMQVLSAGFLADVGCPVINIHHSFLPAFAGAQPYHQAWERGVKLIGATAHYATAELDQGPIIAQDVEPVGHAFTVEDLQRLGRDLERVVLARAVASELADRVIVHEGRTIVF
jgi:formyltetrahydrofolate deformylase